VIFIYVNASAYCAGEPSQTAPKRKMQTVNIIFENLYRAVGAYILTRKPRKPKGLIIISI